MTAFDREIHDVIAETVADLARDDRPPIGVITAIAVQDAALVTLRTRHRADPQHLVMAALAIAGEAEDAVRRSAGDNAPRLAAIVDARRALKQAME